MTAPESPKRGGYLYRQIADELRKEINEGKYRQGRALPGEFQLAERFGVSRASVAKAMELLKREGLIERRRGSGTFAADADRRGEGAAPGADQGMEAVVSDRVPAVFLQPYLADAFGAGEVTIDVWSFTTEALVQRISDQVQRILDGKVAAPESIAVRVLLPDTTVDLSLPRRKGHPEDRRPLERVRGIQDTCFRLLRHSLYGLKAAGRVAEVSVERRYMPQLPDVKLYILNRRVVLQAFYEVEEHDVALDTGEVITITDLMGLGRSAELHPFCASVDSEPSDADLVRRARAFFDSRWEYWGTERERRTD
ncbi:GntR family transcriptional regulator [Streptomyces sp. NPDC023838]|uniref:GntR family transcriptional regulator n=1 Tax=Streptomyces sp. NPDC023838 TaxID=3154325 RepID=UPI0033D01FFB